MNKFVFEIVSPPDKLQLSNVMIRYINRYFKGSRLTPKLEYRILSAFRETLYILERERIIQDHSLYEDDFKSRAEMVQELKYAKDKHKQIEQLYRDNLDELIELKEKLRLL